MKITKAQLKKIILEELSEVSGIADPGPQQGISPYGGSEPMLSVKTSKLKYMLKQLLGKSQENPLSDQEIAIVRNGLADILGVSPVTGGPAVLPPLEEGELTRSR